MVCPAPSLKGWFMQTCAENQWSAPAFHKYVEGVVGTEIDMRQNNDLPAVMVNALLKSWLELAIPAGNA